MTAEPEDTSTLQDAIADLLTRSTNFAGEQLPDVAQQLLAWEQARLTGWLLIDWFLVLAFAVGLVWAWRWAYRERALDDLAMALGILTLFGVLWFLVAIGDAFALAKVITAPKAWLLEYGADMLHKIKAK